MSSFKAALFEPDRSRSVLEAMGSFRGSFVTGKNIEQRRRALIQIACQYVDIFVPATSRRIVRNKPLGWSGALEIDPTLGLPLLPLLPPPLSPVSAG